MLTVTGDRIGTSHFVVMESGSGALESICEIDKSQSENNFGRADSVIPYSPISLALWPILRVTPLCCEVPPSTFVQPAPEVWP
jgi:hypothetical protein